jgi:CRP/FNR family transcriptional regulator, cyclic AMP receptor protein
MNGSELPSSVPPTSDRERIWNVSHDLLIVADANGNLRSINPAWTTTLGWSEGDLLGRTFDWLCHPDDRARTHMELAGLAEGRKTLPFENRFRHKDGSYCWLSWRAVTDSGHLYAVARDVTELKNAEEQLRASRRELAQVSRQMTVGAMTASIAHEVNQPLGAIVANANAGLRWLARAEPDLDEVYSLLRRIVSDGHRAILGPDHFFGEGCLNGHGLRIATTKAMEDCVVTRIAKASMMATLHGEPEFSELFISYLLARNSRIEEDLVDQLFNSSERRLARLLLLLANFGKEGKPKPIVAKISQETLAEMIGTTRARVSHFMNKFRKLGYIDYNGHLEVHNSLLNVVLYDKPDIGTDDAPEGPAETPPAPSVPRR